MKSGLKHGALAVARRWTVGELVETGARRFRRAGLAFGHGTFNARDEAAYLALHALRLPAAYSPKLSRHKASPDGARHVLDLFERRIRERKPAAYLTREAWLGDLRFYVDERVIVPRSHIAGLLHGGLAPWISGSGAVRAGLDLCTGSGCLAIVMARAFPRARIDASDLSAPALEVARINVRRHRLGRRIRLVRSDLLAALRGRRYDLIVCNPPYVTGQSMRRLPAEYRHEPRQALAGGHDGLDLVRRILRRAPRHLAPGGVLLVEVGSGRRAVEKAWPRLPFTWLDEDGGVFLLTREELAAGAALPRARAGRAPRAAGASRRR